MRVKVVWQTGVWIDGEKRKPWDEVETSEETARFLEKQRMVVLLGPSEPPKVEHKGLGRPRKES